MIVEATGVSPEGRITPGCTGLWNDEQAEGLSRIAAGIKAAGAVPGIQIGHAGRKASANRPWEGDDHIAEGAPDSWPTITPSAIAYGENLPRVPRAMTLEDIARVQADFVAAARRARERGLDLLNVSVNFVIPGTQIPWVTPAFLAPIAQRVSREAGVPVASSWCIDDPRTAERVVAEGQMSLVMIGRAHLANPHYAYHLAQTLGEDQPDWKLPAPYAHWLSRYRGAGRSAAAQ